MNLFKVRHFKHKIIIWAVRWYWKPQPGFSWEVDETYIKVKGKWVYLYRALDKRGDTIDFYLSSTRNTSAAKRFLSKAMKSIPDHSHPDTINTDKNPALLQIFLQIQETQVILAFNRQVNYL